MPRQAVSFPFSSLLFLIYLLPSHSIMNSLLVLDQLMHVLQHQLLPLNHNITLLLLHQLLPILLPNTTPLLLLPLTLLLWLLLLNNQVECSPG